MIITSCNSSLFDKVRSVYGIDLVQEIGMPKKIICNKRGTFVFEYTDDALHKIMKNISKYGYNEMQNLTVDYSYGNEIIVVDGYASRNIFYTQKVYKKFTNRIFVDFDTKLLIMFSY